MFTPYRNGAAEYAHYAELSEAQTITLTAQEGTESLPLSAQRFAQLTYQVNPTPIQISGAVFDIGDVGIIDTATQEPVQVSNNSLKVIDAGVISAVNSLSSKLAIVSNSKIITSDVSFTYIADAVPGSLSGANVWRIKRLDANGVTTWADGNNNFDNAASGLFLANYTL